MDRIPRDKDREDTVCCLTIRQISFLRINTGSALCTMAADLLLLRMQRSYRPNANLNPWYLSKTGEQDAALSQGKEREKL